MPKNEHKSVALAELRVEYVPVGKLKPNSYNPNRETKDEFEMLKASMREDGFTTPIICLADGTIVDGEHRWRAAQALGHSEVPVVRVNMTEAQRRIATMRHNRARGQDDISLAASLMQDLEKLGALDWAQDALRLSDEEMRRLVAMADTVAEDLARGHEFSQAWEPVERSTYQPPDTPGEPVSYSKPVPRDYAGTAGPVPLTAGDLAEGHEDAPGPVRAEQPEPMTRRQYVVTLSEAEVVDRVLGQEAAKRLYELCLKEEQRG